MYYFKNFIKYLIVIFIYPFRKFRNVIIYDDSETIKLIKSGYSLGRYGDGEFALMLGKDIGFQKNNPLLKEKLQYILQSNKNDIKNKFIIGIPRPLINTDNYLMETALFWKWFVICNSKKLMKYINNARFANTNLTRPYMDYKKNNYEVFEKRFNNIKKIWHKKKLLIVEGKYTKLGINNDLFDNSISIKRIICPSTNAFSRYKDIYNMIKEKYNGELVLLALGPTATILSYELCKYEKIQCIDIGHIDIEYLWYLSREKRKIGIPGKYVNEAKENTYHQNDKEKDFVYLSQIIGVIENESNKI